jgi:Leucine-rich repeat (LRR) protein
MLIYYCLDFFGFGRFKPEYAFFKMPNPTEVLKILKTSSQLLPQSRSSKCYVENDSFTLIPNVKYLNVMMSNFSMFEIENDVFQNCLENLEELKLNFCNFQNVDHFSFNLPKLNKLKIGFSPFTTPSTIFDKLTHLVELKLDYISFDQIMNAENDILKKVNNFSHADLFSPLQNLQILRIQTRSIEENYFKMLKNLKELYLVPCYQMFMQMDRLKLNIRIEQNALAGLENLVKLDLSACNFGDELKSNMFTGLTNLKELNLANSSIKKITKNAFKGLFKLEYLNLNKLKIDFLLKNAFQDLINLKIIHLDDFNSEIFEDNPFKSLNNLTEVVSNFKTLGLLANGSLKYITKLVINCDKTFEKTLETLRKYKLKNLTSLHLLNITYKFDNIHTNSLNGFENLKEMKLLNNFNYYSMSNKLILNSLIRLEHLDLSQNSISVNDNLLENLTNLRSLNLSSNQSFQIDTLNLKNLKHLDLSSIYRLELNDKLFEQLSNLETLNLSNNTYSPLNKQINERTFYGLINLKRLDLSYNKMKNLNANIFQTLVNLIDLNLSYCEITSVEINTFCGPCKLENLNLSENSIEEMSEDHFRDLKKLKQLNLFNNPFIYRKKDIGKFFKNLNLKDLDLIIDHVF